MQGVTEHPRVGAAWADGQTLERGEQAHQSQLARRVNGIVAPIRAPRSQHLGQQRFAARIVSPGESRAHGRLHQERSEHALPERGQRVAAGSGRAASQCFDRGKAPGRIVQRTHQHALAAGIVLLGERDRDHRCDRQSAERAAERIGTEVELAERARGFGGHRVVRVIEHPRQRVLARVVGRGHARGNLDTNLGAWVLGERVEPWAVVADAMRRANRGAPHRFVLVVEAGPHSREVGFGAERRQPVERELADRPERIVDQRKQRCARFGLAAARRFVQARRRGCAILGIAAPRVAERGVEGRRERRKEHDGRYHAAARAQRGRVGALNPRTIAAVIGLLVALLLAWRYWMTSEPDAHLDAPDDTPNATDDATSGGSSSGVAGDRSMRRVRDAGTDVASLSTMARSETEPAMPLDPAQAAAEAYRRRIQEALQDDIAEAGREDRDFTGRLDPQYIRDAVRQIRPLLAECYDMTVAAAERAGEPVPEGQLITEFTLVGAEEEGGIVETSTIDPNSEITHPVLDECLRETLYTLELPAPEEGGRIMVRYPFRFSQAPDEDEPAP